MESMKLQSSVGMSIVGCVIKKEVVSSFMLGSTITANREGKENVFDEMDSTFSSVPAREKYIVVGDFNVHVGSREEAGDYWSKVRDTHGFDLTKEAGKELHGFLSIQQATVCNIWFCWKENYQVAW